jgi:Spy/CpxP family protein refolding chaperone
MTATTVTRTIGGITGAVLLLAGSFVLVPNLKAEQDTTQTAPAGPRMGRGGPGGPGGLGGRMGGPRGGGPRGGGPLGMIGADLTEQQREQVRAIRERYAEQLRPAMERSRNARQAIAKAVTDGTDYRGFAAELGQAEGELALLHAQIQSEVHGVLTAEQKQKLDERRKAMETRRQEMIQRRGK